MATGMQNGFTKTIQGSVRQAALCSKTRSQDQPDQACWLTGLLAGSMTFTYLARTRLGVTGCVTPMCYNDTLFWTVAFTLALVPDNKWPQIIKYRGGNLVFT